MSVNNGAVLLQGAGMTTKEKCDILSMLPAKRRNELLSKLPKEGQQACSDQWLSDGEVKTHCYMPTAKPNPTTLTRPKSENGATCRPKSRLWLSRHASATPLDLTLIWQARALMKLSSAERSARLADLSPQARSTANLLFSFPAGYDALRF